MRRDLPKLDAFSDEIILFLGEGMKAVVAEGEWPVRAVAFAGRHVLLIRDHGHSLTLSLPVDKSWAMSTKQEWLRVKEEIKTAVENYRKANSQAMSMADVAVALGREGWAPSFPGTPVPSEAWLKKADDASASIGIFQSGAAVRIVIWAGDDMRSKSIASPGDLILLPAWIAPQIADQRRAEAERAVEEARRKALPLPQLEEVMAALRSGKRISVGSGRWSETYFSDAGKLRCEVFDEGHVEIFDATEKDLLRSIESRPQPFREAL